ncbi:putative PurR-regulated permease PerM [Nocardiopsis mwathae]|uniref:Putative PurR-regulated permease PerM n=1 Tax=Nocardiopsis mwathae TaxID=1472723 RepID=A0A7X0D619_9ACTN|nr:AI-2E family transporter [Nocardiopsis mwathae]MBB6172805.1 putative PurR-regulated permease PerM [Nocardiopsis mwathae]
MSAPGPNGMPGWLPRAMILAVWTVVGFGIAGWMLFQLRGLLILLLISLFLALALEPAVNWLHQRGWPRGPATGVVLLGAFSVFLLFVTVLGSMLIGQVLDFVNQLPAMSRALLRWVNATFNTSFDPVLLLDEISDLSGTLERYASSAAENALAAGTTVLALLFNGLAIALFTFYLTADGPRFRRTLCSVLPPRTQSEVLRAWEIAIAKTGGYIYSRALLALISSGAHYAALLVLDIPYAFALALWIGVFSQFIPTVGTYIGGALPVLVALLHGPFAALWLLLFITLYQQFENYLLQPRITARTLDMHPAVAFGAVIAGAAILGAPGALLALPVGASLQAFLGVYIRRYEVAEHPLLDSVEAEAERSEEKPSERTGAHTRETRENDSAE